MLSCPHSTYIPIIIYKLMYPNVYIYIEILCVCRTISYRIRQNKIYESVVFPPIAAMRNYISYLNTWTTRYKCEFIISSSVIVYLFFCFALWRGECGRELGSKMKENRSHLACSHKNNDFLSRSPIDCLFTHCFCQLLFRISLFFSSYHL